MNLFGSRYFNDKQGENICTETFFKYLKNIDTQAQMKIIPGYTEELSNIKNIKPTFTLQHKEKGDQLDGQIEIKDKILIYLEVKVGSSLRSEQLNRYAKRLEEGGKSYKKILWIITKNFSEPNEVKKLAEKYKNIEIIHTSWYDIYSQVKEIEKNTDNPITEFLSKEFLIFLKEKDMKPFEGFTKEDLEMHKFVGFFKKWKMVLMRMKEKLEESGYEINPTFSTSIPSEQYGWPNDYFIYYKINSFHKKNISIDFGIDLCEGYENEELKEGMYLYLYPESKEFSNLRDILEKCGWKKREKEVYWLKEIGETLKETKPEEQEGVILEEFNKAFQVIKKSLPAS